MILNKQVRGFGLMEVLIVMLLISFSILGLAQLQINTLRSARLAQRQQEALYLAESTLEQLRLKGGSLESRVQFSKMTLLPKTVEVLKTRESQRFTVTSTITDLETISGLKQLEVEVNWRGVSGEIRRLILKSARYNTDASK
ncbi:prepilin-type N-terminal cleavage/methylation domain-containing protein [Vibrio sp. DW001]|uniref:type IV pilus modification PilV family protein n=1 Tax=Vibrio sp. DW001 TaxID=2912315 RepID=UPI0023B1C9C7|nr:prepilin-type N-terminal cleavage/methylation domain-containing protein [Vibrio sp. DW001]WED27314.1 prepilin-type N-terminal cleavage/methylation domain-containing protein [Vibrio sp. DW001]